VKEASFEAFDATTGWFDSYDNPLEQEPGVGGSFAKET